MFQIMPDLSENEYAELKKDIQERGVMVPVEYDDTGNVLDGHHRIRACQELGITVWPRLVRFGWSEEQKHTHARALNLARRHLTQEQRRELIRDQLKETPEQSDRIIARGLGVSHHTVSAQRGDLEGRGQIAHTETRTDSQGRKQPAAKPHTVFVSVEAAAKAGLLPQEHQDSVLLGVKKPMEAAREAKIGEVAKKSELPNAKYRVIYADPPWKYGDQLTESYGATRFHYPSMAISELCDLPISDIAEDNAVLFLWVTSPLLAECWPVIKAWGFQYKTSFVWDKVKHNMGHYNSVRHELLLICTRGSCLPDCKELIDSVVSIERSDKHSEKPEEFRNIIDKLYIHGKRIELFSRTKVEGWDSYGNDAVL